MAALQHERHQGIRTSPPPLPARLRPRGNGSKPGADVEQLEERLRRAVRMLVRRQVGNIYSLALVLWHHDTIGDEAGIRAAAGLDPEPPAFDYWAAIGMTNTIDVGSMVSAH